MRDDIIYQERLVHELFVRANLDQNNETKQREYKQAVKDLHKLMYAGLK